MKLKIAAKAQRKLSAVGAYIFAGGFTAGVTKHFDVKVHLEDGPFGVATAKRNFPWLEVHQDPSRWPTKDLKADFVYCNPPCAPWSMAGRNESGGTNWRTDKRVECVDRCFKLLSSMAEPPKVWCFESVRGAYTKARVMIDDMISKAKEMGYQATVLLTDAVWHGVPQNRKRVFLVLSKVKIDWQPGGTLDPLPCGPTFELGLPDKPRAEEMDAKYASLIKAAKPGDYLHDVFNAVNGIDADDGFKGPGKKDQEEDGDGEDGKSQRVAGRPGFLTIRIDPKKPAPTLTGSCTKVHPWEDRFISVPEAAGVSGFDREFKFEGTVGIQYAQVAKGVMPPVAEYLASQAANAIKAAVPVGEDLEPREAWIFGGRVVIKPLSNPGTATPEAQKSKRDHAAAPQVNADDDGVPASVESYVHPELEHGLEPDRPSEKAMKSKDQNWTPPGRRKQNLDRRFDQTQLKSTGHGQTVHRDYAAHFFRWGWATKFIGHGSRVLDVGCGQEQPLVRVLGHHIARIPELYVGVDLNKIPKKTGVAWTRIYDEFNFVDNGAALIRFDHGSDFTVATCFEVIEHMHKKDGIRMLKNLRDLMDPTKDHEILLSTPNFNGKAAANHIHEYTESELRETIVGAGLEVVRQHGTFSNWNDMKKVVTPEELKLIEELKEFYSWDVLSCFLAPKYPAASRNIAWILRRAKGSKCQPAYMRDSMRKAGVKVEK